MESHDRHDQAAYIVVTGMLVMTVLAAVGLVAVNPREGWWWDPVWLAQAQVAFSVIGALLAGGAVLYAWRVARRQFKLMDEQGAIVEKQLAMLQEQTVVSRRIEDVSKRQAEILETQHRIEEAQRARKPAVRVEFKHAGKADFTIELTNVGETIIESFHWEVWVPEKYYRFTNIESTPDHEMARVDGTMLIPWDSDALYVVVTGYYPKPVFQGRPALFARGYVDLAGEGRLEVRLLNLGWGIYTANGSFSSMDQGELTFDMPGHQS